MTEELGARVQHAVGLATTMLGRDKAGTVDQGQLAALLGDEPQLDDFIRALSDTLLLNEMLLMMLWKATGKEPRDTLRAISLHQEK